MLLLVWQGGKPLGIDACGPSWIFSAKVEDQRIAGPDQSLPVTPPLIWFRAMELSEYHPELWESGVKEVVGYLPQMRPIAEGYHVATLPNGACLDLITYPGLYRIRVILGGHHDDPLYLAPIIFDYSRTFGFLGVLLASLSFRGEPGEKPFGPWMRGYYFNSEGIYEEIRNG